MAEGNADDLFGSDQDDSQQPQQEQQYGEKQYADNLEDDIEEEPAGPGKASTGGLFGSDDEDEDEGGGRGRQRRQHGGSSEDEDERAGRQRQHEAAKLLEEAAVPLLTVPATNSVCVMRTTNIVGIQPQPFDPATYEREEETFLDESGRQRVKLATNAVMRWRVRRLPDGREVRESNARFVRWEDGSMQLLLGDEVLDVADQGMAATYLFCLRGGGVFQGQGHLARRLALRPASLDSGLHKRLREVVDKRHTKQFKVVTHGGLQNPELDKARREAAEEERIRGREALQRKQDRVMARAYGGGGRRARSSRLSKDLEDDQEWEGEERGGGGGEYYEYDDGLTADQRARLSLARNRSMMDSNAEAEAGRRLQAAKRGAPQTRAGAAAKRRRGGGSDEEEEEEEEYLEEEEDEPEYESSGEEEGGDEGEEEEGGRGHKPSAPKQASKPAAAPVDNRPKARQRRGVVLSDEEDE